MGGLWGNVATRDVEASGLQPQEPWGNAISLSILFHSPAQLVVGWLIIMCLLSNSILVLELQANTFLKNMVL